MYGQVGENGSYLDPVCKASLSLKRCGFVAVSFVALVDSQPSLVLPQSFSNTRLIQRSRNDVSLRGAERDSGW